MQKKYPFHVDAVCLLPDHLHCILTLPEGESNFSIRWRAIKGIFSREFQKQVNIDNIPQCLSRMKRNELPVWQRRFWEHAIRDQNDYNRHVEYIHYNPVKHGLCDRVRDWPWSSYHQYVRKGLYTNGWDADTDTIDGLETTGE